MMSYIAATAFGTTADTLNMPPMHLYRCKSCKTEVEVLVGDFPPSCPFEVSGTEGDSPLGPPESHEMRRVWQIAGAWVKW